MSIRFAPVLLACFGVVASVAPAQIVFTENFEGGMLGAYTETDGAGTPTPTLWHGESLCTLGTPIPASLGTNAASYNQGDIGTYNFNTGAANSGAIESPAVGMPPGSVGSLAFDYMKDTEASASFDQCFVESKPVGGAYVTDLQIVTNSLCTRAAVTASLSATGAMTQHQFRFNSVDGFANTGQGWTVDNVVLTAALPGPKPNYCALPTAAPFASILGAPGTVVVFGAGVDDTTSAATALPPGMSFYGSPRATFQVNNNGWVAFNQALGVGFFTNAAFPTAAAPNDIIAPWWDDLHTGPLAGGLGTVAYQVTAGGSLIVEWNSMEQFPANLSGENVTFQMELFPDPAHKIRYRYDGATFSSGPIVWSASIGVENAAGSIGLDATGLGTGNAAFPATNLELTYHGSGTTMTTATGCGGLGTAVGGSPNLNDSLTVALTGLSMGGIPVMWIGIVPTAIPLCPAGCTQGTTLDILFPGTAAISGPIPCAPALVGGSFLIQGADVLSAGGCLPGAPFPVPLRVSSTVTVTIG